MNQPFLVGSKVRRLRQRANLTQVALAGRLGVSPSYLNLIERNRRALTQALLIKLGEVLQIDSREILVQEDARLYSDLTSMFRDPLFHDAGPDTAALTRLVDAAPEVARAIAVLYRAYRESREDARSFGEQLADNPYLEATNHRLLTQLTSIRSFAEILRDNADLAAGRRQQYIGTVVTESERLTDLVNELFAYLTGLGVGAAPNGAAGPDGGTGPETGADRDVRPARANRPAVAPASRVSDFVQAESNHFPELEAAAEKIAADLWLDEPHSGAQGLEPALCGLLARRYRIRVVPQPVSTAQAPAAQTPAAQASGESSRLVDFDPKDGLLRIADCLPPAMRALELARRLGLAAAEQDLERAVARAGLSGEARTLLGQSLSGYLAGAILMPYAAFLAAAQGLRHDIELLSSRFGVGFEQACRRLATLQRPGAEGIPFHFLRSDIAGNITEKFTASGLRLPRFGGVCPRWNLHSAFLNSGQVQVQVARLPDGAAYLFLARAETWQGVGFHEPSRHVSVSLGCDLPFADALVYADGLNLGDDRAGTPVGTHCRQCPRQDCPDRAAPSILR